jgi:hypothetical protein
MNSSKKWSMNIICNHQRSGECIYMQLKAIYEPMHILAYSCNDLHISCIFVFVCVAYIIYLRCI